jgi:multicomponent K+:H+ antiporter subunit G
MRLIDVTLKNYRIHKDLTVAFDPARTVASMMHSIFTRGVLSFHELLITLFLFLTAPITAHFIAKVYLHHNVKRGDLPATGTGSPWASEPEEAPGQKQDE